MKRLIVSTLILLLCVPLTFSQAENPRKSRKGSLLGAGLGFHKYETSWMYGPWSYKKRPYHGFSRTGIFLEYEYRSLFKPGIIQFDLNTNLFIGIGGKTMDYWTTDDEIISDGGGTFGISVLLKLAIPVPVGSGLLFTPYTASGFQSTALGSNAQGVSPNVDPVFGYSDGESWTESIVGIPWIIGIEVDLRKIVLSFDYALFITGWTSTTRSAEQNHNPAQNNISLGVGYKL